MRTLYRGKTQLPFAALIGIFLFLFFKSFTTNLSINENLSLIVAVALVAAIITIIFLSQSVGIDSRGTIYFPYYKFPTHEEIVDMTNRRKTTFAVKSRSIKMIRIIDEQDFSSIDKELEKVPLFFKKMIPIPSKNTVIVEFNHPIPLERTLFQRSTETTNKIAVLVADPDTFIKAVKMAKVRR